MTVSAAAQGEWKAIAEGLLSRAQPVSAQKSDLSKSLVSGRATKEMAHPCVHNACMSSLWSGVSVAPPKR